MYQIIVADDQELYRAGIIALVEGAGGFRITAECRDWPGLVQAVTAREPSIIIASTLLVADLAWLMARTVRTASRVLLIGNDSDSLNRYRGNGVAGALHRSSSAGVFLETLRRTLDADHFVMPSDGLPVLQLSPRLEKRLTLTELKILRLLMEGFKNRQIAEHLAVAEHVVKGALQKIFDKTGFSTRLELALFLSRCS